VQIDLDKISDAAKAPDVERLCSSFGPDLRHSVSDARCEANQSMASRDWAVQHIHECIVGSPCRFCPALNLGLYAIRLMARGHERKSTAALRFALQWPAKLETIIQTTMVNAAVKMTVRTLTRMRLAVSSRR